LTDGASAIYGADAVGGVINIITRKDYNGAQISIGKTDPKWGPQDSGDILFGVSGDRGHMMGGFSYQRRAMIYNKQLPYNEPGASTYGNNYISFDPVTGDPTSGVPGNRIVPIPGGCTNKNFYISPNNGRCVYDFNDVAADEAAYGNKAFFLNAEVQINDNWSTYLRTSVTNATTFGRYAPTPGVVFLAPDSPANPTPGSNTYLYHRFAAAGNRDDTTTTNTYDILLGFRGAISDSIDADFGVRYNTSQFTRLGRNYIIGTLAQQAINDGSY